MSSGNLCRYSRGLKGSAQPARPSAGVSRVGFGVSPKQSLERFAMARRHRQVAAATATQMCASSFGCNHCAHSSNAAGSPRRWARASPAKCNEPVSRMGFGFARASSNASASDGVIE